jgi:hypothetical protein
MNHKKAWANDDHVLLNLKFPNLPPDKLVEPPTERDLINGIRLTPTGKYKYRCTGCGVNFDVNSNHKCK